MAAFANLLSTDNQEETYPMDIIARYVHGSEDSTDLDVIYITDRIPEMAECVPFCNEDPNENRNLATVENGIISWSFKGFSDEVNNALLDTYPLHAQEYDLLVEHSVPRDLPVKLLSVLRKSVMELRHTTLRSAARSALRNGYDARLEMLRETDLRCLEWTVTEQQLLDRMKTLAFQFGRAIRTDISVLEVRNRMLHNGDCNELVMLVGIPGSGKSTFSGEYEERGYRIHSSDQIRREMYGSEEIQGKSSEVFELLGQRVRKDLAAGRSCVIDATNLSRKRRTAMLGSVAKYAGRKTCVIVLATPSVCVERNAARNRTPD